MIPSMKPYISLIFLAGGQGNRMKAATPKQFLPLKGKPLARHSFELFLTLPMIQEIVVVCAENYESLFPEATLFAHPGQERQNSVENGFQRVTQKADYVLIHDSARPFVEKKDVEKLLEEGIPVGAATLGVPVKYTIKQIGIDQAVEKTLDRSSLFEIQTPQLLKSSLLRQGLDLANQKNLILTDDVALAELLDHPVKVVTGSYQNLKITTPEDLRYAKV